MKKNKKEAKLILPKYLQQEKAPLDNNGKPMLKFEVRLKHGKNGKIEQAVYIGSEYLDWSVDASSLMEAQRMGPQFFRAAQADITKHFVESVSEFIGRKVTPQEIQTATKTGWI
jgi:hypothetical protein